MTSSGHYNRLGLRWALDTNIIDDSSEATAGLIELLTDGWIALQTTDTVGTEIAGTKIACLPEFEQLPEAFGPLTFGHSRWGSSVLGTPEDSDRIDRVLTIVHPTAERATTRKQHLRDALHISTAIRYAMDGFITRDQRLTSPSARAAVKREFNGFDLLTPEAALDMASRRKQAWLGARE
jgi:hypothetical protein